MKQLKASHDNHTKASSWSIKIHKLLQNEKKSITFASNHTHQTAVFFSSTKQLKWIKTLKNKHFKRTIEMIYCSTKNVLKLVIENKQNLNSRTLVSPFTASKSFPKCNVLYVGKCNNLWTLKLFSTEINNVNWLLLVFRFNFISDDDSSIHFHEWQQKENSAKFSETLEAARSFKRTTKSLPFKRKRFFISKKWMNEVQSEFVEAFCSTWDG